MINVNPTLDLYTILLLIGLVQGLFLSYIFFVNRSSNRTNIFLGSLILVLTLSLAEIFLNYSGWILSVLHLNNFSEPLQLLIGPLFYFYVRSYVGKGMPWPQYLHLIPFILYLTYMTLEYGMPLEQKYNSYIDVYHPHESLLLIADYFDHDPFDIKPLVTNFGMLIHMLLYIGLSFWVAKDLVVRRLKTFLQKDKTEEQSRWISSFLLISVSGIVLFPISKYSFKVVNGENIIGVYITFFIYLIGYFIIRRSAFFSERNDKKYHTSSLSTEWMDQKMARLIELMEKEKPYIKNTFSRSDLASQLSISDHQLSQLINGKTDTNFFGLINRYRTQAAKRLLDDPQNDHLTIEQIAYDVGYNSKSAFYTAFKKEFKMTPHTYRKSKT